MAGRSHSPMEMLGSITVDTDSSHDLGATSKRWRVIYVDTLTGTAITLDGATGVNTLTITDNVADALSVVHGGKDFMVFDTTNSAETVTISQETRINAGKKLVFDAP